MSGYEQRLKSTLTRLFKGQMCILGRDLRREIVEYLLIKLLILDSVWNDPVVPSYCVEDFYKTRAIPPNTTIEILNCVEGRWRAQHVSRSYQFTKKSFVGPQRKLDFNTKTISVGFGNLFVFGVFTTMDGFVAERDGYHSITIHPAFDEFNVFPPVATITSNQAEYISDMLNYISFE